MDHEPDLDLTSNHIKNNIEWTGQIEWQPILS